MVNYVLIISFIALIILILSYLLYFITDPIARKKTYSGRMRKNKKYISMFYGKRAIKDAKKDPLIVIKKYSLINIIPIVILILFLFSFSFIVSVMEKTSLNLVILAIGLLCYMAYSFLFWKKTSDDIIFEKKMSLSKFLNGFLILILIVFATFLCTYLPSLL
jgi:hypothetical protein